MDCTGYGGDGYVVPNRMIIVIPGIDITGHRMVFMKSYSLDSGFS